jgi:hypothetical protein
MKVGLEMAKLDHNIASLSERIKRLKQCEHSRICKQYSYTIAKQMCELVFGKQ